MYAYTERQRDGIIGTAAVQLKAYGHPGAARTASRHQGLTPAQLFARGQANTLYIVAGREHQQLLAPLFVTLLSSLLHHLAETENRDGKGLWPPALFALDETANIAPLQDLPQILATSLPSARFLTIWHSVAQMHHPYGPAGAEELLALSQAKLFLGSITDRLTVIELTRLLGRRATEQNQNPEILTAQALQRTTAGEGLLIHTHQPPTFYRQRRYYQDPTLKRSPHETQNHQDPCSARLAGDRRRCGDRGRRRAAAGSARDTRRRQRAAQRPPRLPGSRRRPAHGSGDRGDRDCQCK